MTKDKLNKLIVASDNVMFIFRGSGSCFHVPAEVFSQALAVIEKCKAALEAATEVITAIINRETGFAIEEYRDEQLEALSAIAAFEQDVTGGGE